MTRHIFAVLLLLATSSASQADLVFEFTDTNEGLRVDVSGSITQDIYIAGLGSRFNFTGDTLASAGEIGTFTAKQASAVITSHDALSIRQPNLPTINPTSGSGDNVWFSFGSMFDDGSGDLQPLAVLFMSRGYTLGSELSGFSVYEGKTIESEQFIPGRYDFTIQEWRTNVPSWQENISIIVSVPEPTTFSMFGIAMVGMLRRRRLT